MRSKNVIAITMALAMVTVWLCSVSYSEVASTEGVANNQLVETATAAFKAARAEYEVGRGTVEDLYQWSRRIMDAELSNGAGAAATNHLARMTELNDRVTALVGIGRESTDGTLATSAAYYVVEAEQLANRRK